MNTYLVQLRQQPLHFQTDTLTVSGTGTCIVTLEHRWRIGITQ